MLPRPSNSITSLKTMKTPSIISGTRDDIPLMAKTPSTPSIKHRNTGVMALCKTQLMAPRTTTLYKGRMIKPFPSGQIVSKCPPLLPLTHSRVHQHPPLSRGRILIPRCRQTTPRSSIILIREFIMGHRRKARLSLHRLCSITLHPMHKQWLKKLVRSVYSASLRPTLCN